MSGTTEVSRARGTASGIRSSIEKYYDDTQILYSRIWSRSGLHYGFRSDGTRGRAEAIVATDRFVGRELGLPMGSRVLDAGCGVGGTSFFLAEQLHHRVLGLTLSREQLRRAKSRVARCQAPIPPHFEIRDFIDTHLDPESFDGVVAIESACHAADKRDFLREAFRLLRPGGRLVVCDGFLAKHPAGSHESIYRAFLRGLALPSLAMVDRFAEDLASVGFVEVRSIDKQDEILPSARSIWRLSWIGFLVCLLPSRLGLFPRTWLGHARAGIVQRRLFEEGVFCYRVFSAAKPLAEPGFTPHRTS